MGKNKKKYCYIDLETTGVDEFADEILQIAIVPLLVNTTENDENVFVVDRSIPSFSEYLIPTTTYISEDATKVHGLTYEFLKENGTAQSLAYQKFELWFNDLQVTKILPIGYNWISFDRMFMYRWIISNGGNYDSFFHYHNRDTLSLVHSLNDFRESKGLKKADSRLHGVIHDRTLFNSQEYGQLKILSEKSHDALYDCVLGIQVHNKLLRQSYANDSMKLMKEIEELHEKNKNLSEGLQMAKKFIAEQNSSKE